MLTYAIFWSEQGLVGATGDMAAPSQRLVNKVTPNAYFDATSHICMHVRTHVLIPTLAVKILFMRSLSPSSFSRRSSRQWFGVGRGRVACLLHDLNAVRLGP